MTNEEKIIQIIPCEPGWRCLFAWIEDGKLQTKARRICAWALTEDGSGGRFTGPLCHDPGGAPWLDQPDGNHPWMSGVAHAIAIMAPREKASNYSFELDDYERHLRNEKYYCQECGCGVEHGHMHDCSKHIGEGE